MTRYRLVVEYDGRPFYGWQRQRTGPSVQQALEEAIHAFSGRWVTVSGAGRTDTGVHALAQVAHIDFDAPRDPFRVQEAVNFHLKPLPVAILDCVEVDQGFDARFSAVGRSYLYRIVNRRSPLTLERGQAWLVRQTLDAEAMAEAARPLVGKHDFTSFRAAECQAPSPVKTLDRLEVTRAGDRIEIVAEARSFLHHQVRNIVGTLALVGRGKWRPEDVATALAARDRSAAGPTAPPDGLYLTAVDYEGWSSRQTG